MNNFGAEEMGDQLRMLSTLLEDPVSVPSTRIRQLSSKGSEFVAHPDLKKHGMLVQTHKNKI